MIESKCDFKAAKFRDEGNALYSRKKFFEALICYNKSLCFAATNEVKSLAFANRSAVYIEAKKYQNCIENIQLALQYGYPEEKLPRLKEREVKCKELMENHQPDPRNDPWNFFQLSYPANKKLPFIVDCLEMKMNSKYGRHIVTNRDLKPGDIIAIEDPLFKVLDLNKCYERCSRCLKSNNQSLTSCEGQCIDTMYCSEKCESTSPQHRQHECGVELKRPASRISLKIYIGSVNIAGGFEELNVFMENKEKLTIFDIDMKDPEDSQTKQKQLMAFFNLKPVKTSKRFVEMVMESIEANCSDGTEEFKFVMKTTIPLRKVYDGSCATYRSMSCSLIGNCDNSGSEKFGSFYSLFFALFNHSCDNNVSMHCVDNKIVALVKHPVKSGEQLFVCYEKTFFDCPIREERRALLFKDLPFLCDCNACRNFTAADLARIKDSNFEKVNPAVVMLDPIKSFKQNCKYIEKNFTNHPCKESLTTHYLFIHLIERIASFGSMQQLSNP